MELESYRRLETIARPETALGALTRSTKRRCSYSTGLGLCSTQPAPARRGDRGGYPMAAEAQGSKDATPPTCAHNRSFLDALPFGDRADFEDAARGFIGTLPKVEFRNADGRILFSLEDYAFLAHEQAPDTVNPSLWRQARLNMNNGLFQVTDRIYQVRGFDISNMTIIEGSRSVIVIDPLVSSEIARAGIELYFQHRGRQPVTAVIYSHSHVDHFGGVRG